MTIKIASYNLWKGAHDTYFRLVDFVKDQQFDVLCLQEINGWQENDLEKLRDFTDRTGFDTFEFGNSNSEYKMATLSRLPITYHNVYAEGFWHCAIETRLKAGDKEITLVNVHLDPYVEEPRLRELHRLFDLIDTSKPVIITGDFNSISRADNYPPDFLPQLQKRKFYKFGQYKLDYRATELMESSGYVDAAANFTNHDITAPSPFGKEYAKDEVAATEAPARIDYFFVNQAAAPFLKSYEVIKNHDSDRLSDHYPIAITLELEDAETKPENKASESEIEKQPAQPTEKSDGEFEIKLH